MPGPIAAKNHHHQTKKMDREKYAVHYFLKSQILVGGASFELATPAV